MKKRHILFLMAFAFLLGSCATPNVAYFTDLDEGVTVEILKASQITIRPEDKISILVNSRDQQLTNLFNLPYVPKYMGNTTYASNSQGVSGYTVDAKGNIDFPVLGELHVAGMTREEIAAYIKEELVSKNLVKDPVVTVDFLNLTVSVLGEVKNPGRYSITKDKVTLLDAISLAGDLTIYGKREEVTVLRDEDGKAVTYKVNLNSGVDLYESPVYYMQQNDLVYVVPNDARARQSTVNGNNVRSTSFWISIASLVATIINLMVN